MQASDVKLEEQAGGVSDPGAPKSEGTTAEGVLGPAPGGKGTTEAGLQLLSAATSFQAEVDSFASRALRRLLWHNDTDVPQPPRHLLRAREAPPEHQQVPFCRPCNLAALPFSRDAPAEHQQAPTAVNWMKRFCSHLEFTHKKEARAGIHAADNSRWWSEVIHCFAFLPPLQPCCPFPSDKGLAPVGENCNEGGQNVSLQSGPDLNERRCASHP